MKKIGIITYYHYSNYGTMLQGYALQRALQDRIGDEGHVEIIDYRFGEKNISLAHLVFIRVKRFFIYFTQLKRIYRLFRFKKKLAERDPLFENFIKTNIPISSKRYLFCEELMEAPPSYDIYVTGSDQTWSPKIGFNEALFLEFAPLNKKRAAYAPSIGVDSFSQQEKAYLKEKLPKYDLISCRESYGATILSNIAGKTVYLVLDPTLMVKAEGWRAIAKPSKIQRDYILCYFLGDRLYYRRFAKQLSRQLGLPLYYIPVSYQDMNSDNYLIWDAGPSEFLGLVDGASVVCTDSFHGMVFSTNFNKNFYGFVKHAERNAIDNPRIYDFLSRVGLEERLVLYYDSGTIDFKEIDYQNTNQLLNKERINSEHFIMQLLNL